MKRLKAHKRNVFGKLLSLKSVNVGCRESLILFYNWKHGWQPHSRLVEKASRVNSKEVMVV